MKLVAELYTGAHFPYMHIECINTEVVGGQIYTLEDLLQREMLAIPEHDDFIRTFLHLALNESQQMLLIHTGRMVHMSINFSDVIEISVRHTFTVCHFLILIEKHVEIELAL